MQILRAVLFLSLFLFTASWNATAQVSNAQPAPDFTLTDTTGQTHNLSDYKGNYVVLEWYNSDCPFVVKHYESKNMPNLHQKYTAKGVVWLLINSSAPGKEGHYSPQELDGIVKKNGGAPTAILLDENGTVGKMYGAKTTPHMFIIDTTGTLIYQGAIDSIASTDSTDIAKAENYVQKALDEAMANTPVSTPSTKSYGCSVKY